MVVAREGPPAVSGTSGPTDPTDIDVLFREAKRRERRRRLAWVAIVVLVVGAVAALTVMISSPSTTTPHQARVSTPGAARSTPLPAGARVSLIEAGPLAVGPTGALYVADDSRHEVLVRLATGQFRVVAGNGKQGFSGDGGRATKAELSDVSDMSVAPNGDLYLADGGRVRVVDRNGTIRTIAGDGRSGGSVANGTPARSAPLGPGISLAFSPTGRLYLASSAQLFRLSPADKLDVARAVVSSGVSRGELDGFGSIAVDAHGNVYASSTFDGWSVFRISPDGVATDLGYARRSGGAPAVIERGADGVIEADDGPNILRVEGDRLVTSFAVNDVPGITTFIYTDYFALAADGTVYADNLGPPAFEPYQQIVSVSDGHAESLWRGAVRKSLEAKTSTPSRPQLASVRAAWRRATRPERDR